MTEIAIILLLAIFQFLIGFGILALFNIRHLNRVSQIALSVVLGIAVFSLVPFILQLLFIKITFQNILIGLLISLVAANLCVKRVIVAYKQLFEPFKLSIKLYELPFIGLIAFMMMMSAWRCFYLPPTPRDLTSGPEVIAQLATKEHTFINSIFSVNLETTNNIFKPLYITSLQVIYKYAGFPFGQVWLTVLAIAFTILLYNFLCERLHKILAGILVVAFFYMPEVYGYTFMVLFDYSNMVFYFLSLYFLFHYLKNKQVSYIVFSGMLMGIATYIRPETLVLAAFNALLVFILDIKRKEKWLSIIRNGFVYLFPSILFYIICVVVYNNHYLPMKYATGDLVTKDFGNIGVIFSRMSDIFSKLIYSDISNYYGYFFTFFLIFFFLELVIKRKFNNPAKYWLAVSLIVWVGIPVLGYLLPLFDLLNTSKRGLFKLFPPLLFYLQNNYFLVKLSEKITAWENK